MGLFTNNIFPDGGEDGSGGGIIQTVFVDDTTARSFNINNATHTTSLQASITLNDSSNKVIIMYSVNASGNGSWGGMFFGLKRDSTSLVNAENSNNPFGGLNCQATSNGHNQSLNFPIFYIDSPNDTSSHTYKVLINGVSGCGNGYINRSNSVSTAGRSALILYEVCS